MARRRERAKELGLCSGCCKARPQLGRVICAACHGSRTERKRRARAHFRDAAPAQILEAVGDDAVTTYAYENARRFYEARISKLDFNDPGWGRVAEKIAEATYRGDAPHAATSWFERALTFHENTSGDLRNAALIMLRLARQCWLNADTGSALPLIESAMETAKGRPTDDDLWMRTSVAMAHYLVLLSRLDEARPYLQHSLSSITGGLAETRVIALTQHAILAAACGDKEQAFELFERAIAATTALPEGYLVTVVWDDYALWSLALGDLDVSRVCRERALLAAHEQNIPWRIAYLSLRYADLLLLTREWDRAADLVMNASRHALDTPVIRLLLMGSGLPLGLELNDRRLIELCLDERLVDVAFQSGEDARIASAVGAVAQYYVAQRRMQDAATILARGVRAIHGAAHCWGMLIDSARYCEDADALRARDILSARTAFPHDQVALASLSLFDAYRAERSSERDSLMRHASSAAEQFTALGWAGYAHRAMALLGRKPGNVSYPVDRRLGDLGAGLTPRELEVAELVLKGLTNRAIAVRLNITENTVESHMSSILMRLGVRSRWQLKEAFDEQQAHPGFRDAVSIDSPV